MLVTVNTKGVDLAGKKGKFGAYVGEKYVPVLPLDAEILKRLPEEGTLMGGLYPLGTTVKSIVQGFDGALTSDQITGRLRYMSNYGLCDTVATLGGSRTGWQVTAAGKKWVKEVAASDSNNKS